MKTRMRSLVDPMTALQLHSLVLWKDLADCFYALLSLPPSLVILPSSPYFGR